MLSENATMLRICFARNNHESCVQEIFQARGDSRRRFACVQNGPIMTETFYFKIEHDPIKIVTGFHHGGAAYIALQKNS